MCVESSPRLCAKLSDSTVPFGVVGLLLGWIALPDARGATRRPFDWQGTLLLIASLVALALDFQERSHLQPDRVDLRITFVMLDHIAVGLHGFVELEGFLREADVGAIQEGRHVRQQEEGHQALNGFGGDVLLCRSLCKSRLPEYFDP